MVEGWGAFADARRENLGFRVYRLRVYGLWFRVWGLGSGACKDAGREYAARIGLPGHCPRPATWSRVLRYIHDSIYI